MRLIYSDQSANMNKNMITLQITNSYLLKNNTTNVLSNNEADVNNQMSRKYKEENIRSYLKGFNSLVAFDADTEGGIQCFDAQS